MTAAKMEFMVENVGDGEELKRKLSAEPNILRAEVVGKDAVVVESSLTSERVADILQNITKGNAILWGFGDSSAAVSIVEGDGIRGVVRFGALAKQNTGLVDGTIDGLPPGEHDLQIHVAGDISNGCNSLGPVWGTVGKLGRIIAEDNGRAEFKFVVPQLQIEQIVGRSLAVATPEDTKRFACGIIARSAGIFENNKRICACNGVTLWDEKYMPSSGYQRR